MVFLYCVNCKNLHNIGNTPVCKLFGVYDMVHGTTTYLSANHCRRENKLCDTSGIFFAKKNHQPSDTSHNLILTSCLAKNENTFLTYEQYIDLCTQHFPQLK